MREISLICVVGVVLSGCASAVVEGGHIARNRSIVNDNISKANRGDRIAQYKVGNAHCCSIDEKDRTFYSTRKAVGWLCASAVQGYAPAMYKIGKIYSGDVVRGTIGATHRPGSCRDEQELSRRIRVVRACDRSRNQGSGPRNRQAMGCHVARSKGGNSETGGCWITCHLSLGGRDP